MLDPVSRGKDTGLDHAVGLLHADAVDRTQGVDGFDRVGLRFCGLSHAKILAWSLDCKAISVKSHTS
jgi:hypothetical protein